MAVPGAAITQLVPVDELAPGGAAAIRNQVTQALLAQAASEQRMPVERLVARDIRPGSDLDYGSETWEELTGATTGAYESMSTGTLADQRYVAFFGVQDDSPVRTCSLLKFNIGGGDRAIWNLQNLGKERVGYSPSAIVIPPNGPYTISRYVTVANLGAYITLKGVVVEPRGKVVSP